MSSSFTVYIVRRTQNRLPDDTIGVFGSANNAFLRGIEHLQESGASSDHCLKLHSDSTLRSKCRAGETIFLKSDILVADRRIEPERPLIEVTVVIEKCEVK
ncbi:MAG: hypothetical protein O6846_03885 [Thaumarchaeota archaeon]|nr:hypothetical protein [Nitrososphaerota archaeon]